jgi:WD40 repeat protein/serine/threonine protein kinase
MAAPSTQAGSLDDAVNDVFLDYLLAEDAGRTPDARELLDAHPDLADKVLGFLDDREVVARQARLLRDLLRDVPDEGPTDHPPDLAGYEPLRYLAHGGMGVVYVAWQTLAQRSEAIKVIRDEALAGPAERQRFLVEAQRAAGLEHPNIIRIYHVGVVNDRPFFSMEYAAGGSVAGRVQALRGQWDEVATLLRTVAHAVHFAHQRGVLHCDLKPANILLADDGTPRVADFGLAEVLRPGVTPKPAGPDPVASQKVDSDPAMRDFSPNAANASTVDNPVTESYLSRHVIAGTPGYMAPEQARGERGLTVAVDVYGLGAILYQCLTERAPFRGDTPEQTLQQVREQAPTPPRRHAAVVPRDLEAICLKCLEKDPEDRYASAAALAEDLRRFLAREPVEARPIGRLTQLVRRLRRRPLTAALGAVAALLAIALVATGCWWLWRLEYEYRLEQQLYTKNVGRAKKLIDAGHLSEARETLEECSERLRCWEWHYLRGLCRQELRLQGHEGAVESVRYSPCGRYILTGGHDGTARLWDAKTGATLRTFGGHRGRVRARFTGEGRLVVSAGEENDVLVREADTDKEILHLKGVGNLIACDRQGRHLAVCLGNTVRLYDLRDGRERRAVAERRFDAFVLALDFNPDGARLAVGGFKGQVDLLQVPSLEVESRFSSPDHDTIWALAFSPDGKRLVASLGSPLLWDLTGKDKGFAVLPGTGMFCCRNLAFSPDSKRLVGAGNDGFVRVWDVDRRVMVPGTQQPQLTNDAAFSPDGTALAITRGWAVVVEPLAPRVVTNRPLASYPEAAEEVEAVACSPDGTKVASLVADVVLLHDLGGGEPQRYCVPRGQPGKVKRCLGVGDNGRILVATAEAPDGRPRVVIRDAKTGGEVASTWVRHKVQSLAFDHKGRLYWGDNGGHVHRLAPGSSAAESLEVSHGRAVTALACSPDGGLIATGGVDLTVQIWRGGERLHVRRGHDSPPECLAFSPDGRRLVSGGSDGRMKVWDVGSGVELFELSGHGGKVVSAVAFDRAGERLASCGHDGVVRLWDGSQDAGR